MYVFLGGTFNPIHNGHIRLAAQVRELLGTDTVHLVPSNIPPHRDEPEVSPQDRLRMIELALENETGLQVDERELARAGKSYSVDTLGALRQQYGEQPLIMILGMDAFAGLPSWHQYEELWALTHFVVADRPDHSLPPLPERVANRQTMQINDLFKKKAGFWYHAPFPLLDIASSQIRERIKNGLSCRDLLPDSVLRYITTHDLYSHG